MSTLTLLGIASMIFTAAFTMRAYRAAPGQGQSPRSAVIEAWLNIVVGFSINYVANLLILPMVGAQLTLSNNFWMGWVFTSISILRQYAIRRWFNARLHMIAAQLGGQ